MSKRQRRTRKHRGQPPVAHVPNKAPGTTSPENLGDFLLQVTHDWPRVWKFLVVLVGIMGAVSLLLLVSATLGVPSWASGIATVVGGGALGMTALGKRKGS